MALTRHFRTCESRQSGHALIAVILEVEPEHSAADRCFEIAAAPNAELESVDGFISVERFESLAKPGRFLSLSFWCDEASVRDHGLHEREVAPADSRSALI